MKIIYIPNNFYNITKMITNILSKNYLRMNTKVNIDDFKFINIIISIDKDFSLLSNLLLYCTPRVLETQNSFFISLNLFDACKIAFTATKHNDFSLLLNKTLSKLVPNIFNSEEFDDYIEKNNNHIMYHHSYINILNDTNDLNNSHKNILIDEFDLDFVLLAKLFKITTYMLLPLNELMGMYKLENVCVSNNDYNFYLNSINTNNMGIANEDYIISYLNMISINDKYTDRNIQSEFNTTIGKINCFAISTYRSYKKHIDNINDILPSSILLDTIINISLFDIIKYKDLNHHINNLYKTLTFRNNYMSMVFNKLEEELRNDN